jgi:hypothetical protein
MMVEFDSLSGRRSGAHPSPDDRGDGDEEIVPCGRVVPRGMARSHSRLENSKKTLRCFWHPTSKAGMMLEPNWQTDWRRTW